MKIQSILATLVAILTTVTGSTVSAEIPKAGNLLVSFNLSGENKIPSRIREYTKEGKVIQEIDSRPIDLKNSLDDSRDLVVDNKGVAYLYNGTFKPELQKITFSDKKEPERRKGSFPGWSTVKGGFLGGIAQNESYVFLSDMRTNKEGSPKGIIRFDKKKAAWKRFHEDFDTADLNMGLDGKLYALHEDGFIRVIDPKTMKRITQYNVSNVTRFASSVSADNNGKIYLATWKGFVFRINQDALVELKVDFQGRRFYDIDLFEDGTLALAQDSDAGQGVCITDKDMKGARSFKIGNIGESRIDSIFLTWVPK